MKKTIALLLENWRETRALTFDLINSVSTSLLNKKLPRPGLNTFAKQILELADVETAYTLALLKNKIDFSKTTDGTEIKGKISKQKLLATLLNADMNLSKAVKAVINWNEKVSLFSKSLPKYSILELITRHETLHHGQFIAYGFLLNLKFPQTWVNAWAIPQNDKK